MNVLVNDGSCTIEHEGQQFTANGAYLDDEGGCVYIQGNKATTWDGRYIGRVNVISTWRMYLSIGVPFTMAAVQVTLPNGRRYHGRYGSDWSQLCRLRRVKSKKDTVATRHGNIPPTRDTT